MAVLFLLAEVEGVVAFFSTSGFWVEGLGFRVCCLILTTVFNFQKIQILVFVACCCLCDCDLGLLRQSSHRTQVYVGILRGLCCFSF